MKHWKMLVVVFVCLSVILFFQNCASPNTKQSSSLGLSNEAQEDPSISITPSQDN